MLASRRGEGLGGYKGTRVGAPPHSPSLPCHRAGLPVSARQLSAVEFSVVLNSEQM